MTLTSECGPSDRPACAVDPMLAKNISGPSRQGLASFAGAPQP